MKIESTGKPMGVVQPSESRAKADAVSAKSGSASEKVELSALSSSLQKAEAAIAETPVVDAGRVAEIKAAISEGRFKIDANRIADGLIDSVRNMLDNQSSRI
ncbi:flagellar biosynthesis anti-sigma factor FlgM [Azoarcus communis]|uniref:Negative regulator of flagellin synthesis n=1 Tax=Parazoarcus communis SWub3 = DSM 12120 TaxID=1121029 RepID=A0A323V123_9RHOO|nr:flagellar biosynthesis anti-sigma factor FlgM [Parazoarcus communis]NMG47140.1 flagellar biosynthesis anti-sigma factor FlgM [Parazoarcus communis]NMG70410.1 flagellar biosynthesis anti-sigma factor FlgM [Parazoarcus communis SWub3 = DSM 12120]PZA17166.1 flagellar biosynthesis anti-sigma factor FlgM [Azoarcus communis] [Parazoarcus communis SWub3 = DSM 12120]